MDGSSKNKSGLISISVGAILGVVAIGMSSWNSFWEFLGVPIDQRDVIVAAVTILFVNLGFVVGLYFQQKDFSDSLLAAQKAGHDNFRSNFPSLKVFSSYSGHEAMDELIRIIGNAKVVSNTRILSPSMSKTSHSADSPWDKAVRQAVRNGTTFREIVSPNNEGLAVARSAACVGGKGEYQAAVLNHSLPSFMNFIVLEMHSGNKEVWFGWIVSPISGYEGPVVRSSEERIVSMFDRWHKEMLASADSLPS